MKDKIIQITNGEGVTPQVRQHKTKKVNKLVIIFLIIVLLFWGIIILISHKTAIPLENETFYTAIYKNQPVLFYRFAGMLNDLKPVDKNEGQYVTYTEALSPKTMKRMTNVHFADFSKLQNPKKLFAFNRYATLIDVRFSKDNSSLIMSYIGGMEDNINYIYQVNLNTTEAKKIWEHTLRSGNPPLNEGDAYITQFVPDHFVVFDILQGDPPPDSMPIGTVVLNIQTSAIKTLDPAGDIQINQPNNTVSFKKLHKTLVPCEGKNDPVCFKGDTQKYGFEPNGPIETQQLP